MARLLALAESTGSPRLVGLMGIPVQRNIPSWYIGNLGR